MDCGRLVRGQDAPPLISKFPVAIMLEFYWVSQGILDAPWARRIKRLGFLTGDVPVDLAVGEYELEAKCRPLHYVVWMNSSLQELRFGAIVTFFSFV